MKLVIVLLLSFFGVWLYFGAKLHSSLERCHTQFEPRLESIRAQWQSALSDKQTMCTDSYESITGWELCLEQAKTHVPEFVSPVFTVFVSQVQIFLGNAKKDIPLLKLDHDQWCSAYPNIHFSTVNP